MLLPMLAVALTPFNPPTNNISSRLAKLQSVLKQESVRFHGRLGYSVLDLASGKRIEYRADENFPTASTIKTAVALHAIREVDAGRMKWSDQRELPPMAKRVEYDQSEWTYFMKDGLKLNLDAYVNLMIVYSDNFATRVLREWMGTVNINRSLDAIGVKGTRLLASAPAEETLLRRLGGQFGMGMTTPNSMNRLLELIYRRKAASPAGCERLLRIMSHQYWDDLSGVSVPVGVTTAIKNGAINRSRSETAIVFAPRPYILTIYTDSQKDQRWTSENEGEVVIRRMCRSIWNALEPGSPYAPPVGFEKFLPTGGGVE